MPKTHASQIRRQVEDLWIKEFTATEIAAALNISVRQVWRHTARIREDYVKWTAGHEAEFFRKQTEALNLAVREAWLSYHSAKPEDINSKIGCLNTIAKLLAQRGEMLGVNTGSGKVDASLLYAALQKRIQDEMGYVSK